MRGFCRHSLCFAGLWTQQAAPQWEQQRRAPVRARGAEDGGGAPGPSTVKGKIVLEMVKFFKEMKCFSLPPHAGPGDAPKGASPSLGGGADSLFSVVLCWQNFKICECLLAMPSFQCIGGGSVPPPMPCRTLGRAARRKARRLALAEAPILFFLSYCVGKTLKSVNVCLQCPVFNALGAAVCRPQCLAGRWAGRRAEKAHRLALAEAPNLFSLSYCVGKTLKCVNVCLQRPVFNASGPAVCRPQSVAGRWAGRRAERRVAWPWRRRRIFFLCRIVLAKR